jgi:hypothetical protein
MFNKIEALLDFIKGIAWPFAVIFLIFHFGAPIKNILKSFDHAVNQGGVKLSPSGVEILANQREAETIREFIEYPKSYAEIFQQNKVERMKDPLYTKSESPGDVLSNHQRHLNDDIESEIEKFLKKNEGKKSRECLLKNLLCDAYICLYFERTFQRILGSQMKLLEKLDESPTNTIEKSMAYALFTKVLPENAQMQASFSKWLEFLEGSCLISPNDEKIILKDEGKEFLSYLKSRKYNLYKPS